MMEVSMKVEPGQIVYHPNTGALSCRRWSGIHYLMVEVKLDDSALIARDLGLYAMVIFGHSDRGKLWPVGWKEYPAEMRVVEDVWFCETDYLTDGQGEPAIHLAATKISPSSRPAFAVPMDQVPPGFPFIARDLSLPHSISEGMFIKSTCGYVFGMNGFYRPSHVIRWEDRPVLHQFVWESRVVHFPAHPMSGPEWEEDWGTVGES
jgi:hypothetical protein